MLSNTTRSYLACSNLAFMYLNHHFNFLSGPSAPHSIEVQNVFATNLTLLYNVSDDKYSYFRFNICNETCVQSYQSNGTLSKTVGNLSVATLYRIEVYTVINTINGTLESENTSNNCISSFTGKFVFTCMCFL
jgi:hypothetical protein